MKAHISEERPAPMATGAREHDDLLSRYRRALVEHGEPEPYRADQPLGHDVRTCTNCGERSLFVLDARGGWAYCQSCREVA